MAKQLYVNNFTSTFIGNVAASAVTGTPATELGYGILQLNSGAASYLTNPTGGDYYILTAYKRSGSVESSIEIMKVTAVDNSVINECRVTVTRAQEGTSAQAYVPGDYISLRITKGGLSNMAQAADVAAKQDVLVSGTTLKTIGGSSLLGSGDISVGIGDVTLSGVQTLSNKTIQGTTNLATGQANFVQVAGAATSGSPSFSAQGSDSNVNLSLYGKGSGGVTLWSQGVIGFSVSNPASAVNYISAAGSVSGSGVLLAAAGSDADISIAATAKGSGAFQAWSNGGAVFTAFNPSSAVNLLGFNGQSTGQSPNISAIGADTNISIRATPKGTGVLEVLGGGVLLGGSSQRLTADFSNATPASRTMLQTSTTNGNTIASALPNGSGTASYWQVYNSSDVTNASYVYLGITSSIASINSAKLGTGTALPLVFSVDSTEACRIDTALSLKLQKAVYFASEYNAGNSGTAVTVNFANGQKQKLTLTGNATVTLSFPGVGSYQILLVQDATGSRTVTWSGVSKYVGSATAPAINTTASSETVVSLYYDGSAVRLAASKVNA